MVRDTGSPGDLTHAFKANVVYELPFGQGRRFGGKVNGVVDRIIGGWSLGLTSRIQSGTLVNLGNERLVGMSTIKAFSVSAGRIFRPAPFTLLHRPDRPREPRPPAGSSPH